MLWFDHEITSEGLAYTNYTGRFYPINNKFSNIYTFASPYQPMVYDSSILGANIISGVTISGVFISTGFSGLNNINYERGQVYFNNNIANSAPISGSFAIKDFHVKFATDSEERILFETKHNLRPKFNQTITGINSNETTYPVIYLRDNGGRNEEFALGGLDNSEYNIRAIIIAKSQFDLDATLSICRDSSRKFVPLLSEQDMPFNEFGGLKSGVFNYDNLFSIKPKECFISDVYVSKLYEGVKSETNAINTDMFVGFVDFSLSIHRYPRL